MANIFNINSKSILATASITITDQTDAASLAGGISVVSGSKNQVFLTGTTAPYSPDWSKSNLVLRPYVYATTITRAEGTTGSYNPDLFDPDEYPDLSKPNDNNVSTAYINTDNLFWYIRDANGTETVINPETNSNFSFIFTYNNTVISDKRYLVIKNNFIPKDSFVTIICRYSFYDPFAKLYVNQSYEIDLSCLSTGGSTSQLLINSVNGTSIYNSFPTSIDLYATYYKDGVEVDIQKEIEDPTKSSSLYWYIRSSSGQGWTLLDGTKQADYADLFEVHRYTTYDPTYNKYALTPTNNKRGGFYLIVKPGLIDGSSVIKAVYTASDEGKTSTALEVVYDATDDVQAYIHSSNGDKIYQGVSSLGTTLTCMVKYQGKILEANDTRYETNFEYYWFKVSADGSETWNIWLDNSGNMMSQKLLPETEDSMVMMPSSRVMPIRAEDVDSVNMFQCAIIDKVSMQLAEQRSLFILNSPSEEDLIAASVLNNELGIEDNSEALLNTAYEINALHISDGTSLKD